MDHAKLVARLDAKRAAVGHARRLLAESLGLVVGEMEVSFPEGSDPVTSGGRDGLARLGSRIEDVMECHDRLQVAFGLPEGEAPRFARFFADREARRAAESATP
jgi:hypothetical protein